MPVYIRKDVSYTPPSLDKIQPEQEDDFINDPDQLKDTLPQPYRMIDKTLHNLLDDTWDVISAREEARLKEARKVRPPQYESQITLEGPVPGTVNEKQNLTYATAMCESPDGQYIFIGVPVGLVSLEAQTQQFLGSWEDPNAEIVFIKTYPLAPQIYLLVTIDDMGIGRLFAFGNGKYFMLKVMNASAQDSDNKILVSKLEASAEGDYVGMVMENPSSQDLWLEVHKAPRETWLSDLDTIITAMRKKEEEKQREEMQSEMDTESVVASEVTVSQAETGEPSVASLPVTQQPDTQETGQSLPSNGTSSRGSVRFNLFSKTTVPKPTKRSRPASGGSLQGTDPTMLNIEPPKDPLSGDFKFGSPQLVMKVKPPAPITGVTYSSLQAACQKIDSGEVVGTGANHVFTPTHLELRRSVFEHQHDGLLKYLPSDDDEEAGQKIQQYPNFHFLTAGRMLPLGLEQAGLQGRPTIVAVWWPGSTNFMQYSLIKTSKDIEFKPDLVWPFTNKITCSEVSPDTNLIALGLENGNVVVWDKYMGTQRGVVSVSDVSAVVQLKFLPASLYPQTVSYYPPYRTTTGAYLLAMCANSAMYTVAVGPGMPLVVNTISLPVETDDETVTILRPYTSWPDMMLTVTQRGDVQIRDTLQGKILCQIKLPNNTEILSPWEPILGLGNEGQILFVKGSKTVEEDESVSASEGGSVTNLQTGSVFVYQLSRFPSLDEHWKMQRSSLPYTVHTKIEQRVDALMADRMSQQAARKERMQERWQLMKDEINTIHARQKQARINADNRPLITFEHIKYPHYQTPGSVTKFVPAF